MFNSAMASRRAAQAAAVRAARISRRVIGGRHVGGGQGAMLAACSRRAGARGSSPTGPRSPRLQLRRWLAQVSETGRARSRATSSSPFPQGPTSTSCPTSCTTGTTTTAAGSSGRCASAMDAGSRWCVVERLLGVPGAPPPTHATWHFVDLHMLVMFGARERPEGGVRRAARRGRLRGRRAVSVTECLERPRDPATGLTSARRLDGNPASLADSTVGKVGGGAPSPTPSVEPWRRGCIDVHDDEVCASAYEVIVASKGHERPWNEPPSLAETLVEWRHVDAAERMELWGVDDGDELVGVGDPLAADGGQHVDDVVRRPGRPAPPRARRRHGSRRAASSSGP